VGGIASDRIKYYLIFSFSCPGQRGRKHTKEEIKKISEFTSKYYSNPSVRKKMSRLKKEQYRERPELIEKIDRKITEW
jgi:hypothetical protein